MRILSDEEIFEDELIGICPRRRFSDRSKYSRRGSSNNDAGMLPLNWLDPRYNFLRFLRFSKAVMMHIYDVTNLVI
jgi:hypothetical protein